MHRTTSALIAFTIGIIALSVGHTACGSAARVVTDRVDPTIQRAAVGTPGWEYSRTASGDFDGDGVVEKAAIIARVARVNNELVWEDWNVWQMYIEEPTGER